MAEKNEINYAEVLEFLHASSDEYSSEIARAKEDLEFYSGNQWSSELKKSLNRFKNPFVISELPKFVNAIKSSASKNAFHTELVDAKNKDLADEIQAKINKIESENQFKLTMLSALESAVIHGQGVISLTTIEKNGEVYPLIEHIRDLGTVAFDADCVNDDKSDAEKGAIVNYISKSKAERLYDIDSRDFTDSDRREFPSAWTVSRDNIPVVTYYKLIKGGCSITKWVGKEKVFDEVLTLNTIPLYKLTGYIVYRDGKFNSTGIVDRVKELQIVGNLSWSQLVSRMSRSVKAGYIVEMQSIENIEHQISGLSEGDVPLFVYNTGTTPPIPIVEHFETQDIINVIDKTSMMIASTIGIPTEGVIGINNVNTTATEVITRQENAESNVSCFYDSMSGCVANIAKSICQILTSNTELPFETKIINDSDTLNTNAKNRKEILNMIEMVDDKTRPLLASFYAKNLDDNIGDEISKNIIANLPNDVQVVSSEENAEAMHVMQQSKEVIDSLSEENEMLIQELNELQKQIDISNVELMNQRETRAIDYEKFRAEHALDVQKTMLELQLKDKELADKFEVEMNKIEVEGEKNIIETIKANDIIMDAQIREEEASQMLEELYGENRLEG